jgi:hypothetical protein
MPITLTLADSTKEIILIGGLVIALVSILLSFIRSTVVGIARERTRREIAAYIAEGSMTADDGERLMKAREPEAQD